MQEMLEAFEENSDLETKFNFLRGAFSKQELAYVSFLHSIHNMETTFKCVGVSIRKLQVCMKLLG